MNDRFKQAAWASVPIVILIISVLILLVLVGANPGEVLDAFNKGAFRNIGKLAGVLEFWIPLALASLGLTITFTAGLWNIGVEGQMIIGGLCAAAVAYALPNVESQAVLIVLEIIAAMIGGALWGLLIGVLKTQLGVNEIFGGVALNAIASLITLYLVNGVWANPSKAGVGRELQEAALLPPISDEFEVSLFALVFLAISIAFVIWLILRTRWGLNLKAVGRNPRSALLLGVPTNYSALGALMLCGALAGVGGAHRVIFSLGRMEHSFTGGIGFLGLLVVLLVAVRPVLVPIVAFIFAAMLRGGTQLQFLDLSSSLTGVIQGVMVLAVMLGTGIRDRLRERIQTPTVAETSSTPDLQGSES